MKFLYQKENLISKRDKFSIFDKNITENCKSVPKNGSKIAILPKGNFVYQNGVLAF